MKTITYLLLAMTLMACSVAPQKVAVMPSLSFEALDGVGQVIELRVEDNRENTHLLGYRNSKKEGPIEFKTPLVKAVGESVKKAMLAQNIQMRTGPEPVTVLTLKIEKLQYSSPNKNWVSRIDMQGEILLMVSRAGSSFKKRFSGNRGQDVATAPSESFNEKYMNTLLSELINKALNDPEVVRFIK